MYHYVRTISNLILNSERAEKKAFNILIILCRFLGYGVLYILYIIVVIINFLVEEISILIETYRKHVSYVVYSWLKINIRSQHNTDYIGDAGIPNKLFICSSLTNLFLDVHADIV